MFVRTLEGLAGTDKEMVRVDGNKRLQSRRLITKADTCGFSMSDVRLSEGWSIDLWYKNHVEGNLVVSGDLKVEDLNNGNSWDVGGGGLYVVGPKDRHRITAKSDVHIVSVFNPATLGTERHDADGSYPPTGEIPPEWQGENGRTMFVKRLEDTRVVGISHGKSTAYRYLNQEDGCGFTMSTPRSPAGKGIVLWYKNHVEANYILEGEGTVEDLDHRRKVGPGPRHHVLRRAQGPTPDREVHRHLPAQRLQPAPHRPRDPRRRGHLHAQRTHPRSVEAVGPNLEV